MTSLANLSFHRKIQHVKCLKEVDQITWLFLGDIYKFSSTSFLRENILGSTNNQPSLSHPNPTGWEKITKTILQIHLFLSAWKIE